MPAGSDSAMLDNALEFSGNEWYGASTCRNDNDSGALGKQPFISVTQKKKDFLPVLRHNDGAMGWPGFHLVLRWRFSRSSA